MDFPLMALRAAVATCLAASAALIVPAATALEGGEKSQHGQFGVVGSFAPNRSAIGSGFSGVQIAPHWVLTAAHVAPAAGSIFVDDYGMSGIAEVLTFPVRVPSSDPLVGALRDDIALVRLAAAIDSPYFPQLADDTALPGPGSLNALANLPLQATLVSNNPSMKAQRFGNAHFRMLYRIPGCQFLVVAGHDVSLVVGDSGSPSFLGRIRTANAQSVVAGVATGQGRADGEALGVYTRVGPYRALIDAALRASGESVRWYSAPPEAARRLSSR